MYFSGKVAIWGNSQKAGVLEMNIIDFLCSLVIAGLKRNWELLNIILAIYQYKYN